MEDDWFLKKKVLKDDIFEQFVSDEKLTGIRLNLSRNPSERPLYSDGLSLNPSIFRTSVIQSLLGDFDIAKDPEKQFRKNESLKMQKFFYYGRPKESSYVVDTGKKWRKSLGLTKWKSQVRMSPGFNHHANCNFYKSYSTKQNTECF